jgi:transposase
MSGNPGSELQRLFDQGQAPMVTERIDDVILLIGQMMHMGLPQIIDQAIPRHGPQRALSWGWTATIWLAHILTEGDHRKVSMVEYIKEMGNSLRVLIGQPIEELDFDDDRLTHLLKHLSQDVIRDTIERALGRNCVEVYELTPKVVRCDTTTVSGHHQVDVAGVMQFGHSKGDPTLPQCKLATATLDVGDMGLPLATAVGAGETADDGLYVPLATQVTTILQQTGLLLVGDSKMSSRHNREMIAAAGQYYLCPLPLTGDTARVMPDWITEGIEHDQRQELTRIDRENERGQRVLIAKAYEFERPLLAATATAPAIGERVLIVQSLAYAQAQGQRLENRLCAAEQALAALTPPPGRGQRQIRQESDLQAAIAAIETQYGVAGLLMVTYERESRVETRYVGRGRGAAQREQRTIEQVRYQITAVVRNAAAIVAARQRLGWKAYVTTAPADPLPLVEAVLCYRHQYRAERVYQRIKSHLNIEPLFVQRDDQIKGLTFLLTLGARVLTLLEFVVRRSLAATNTTLSGLFPDRPEKETAQPTAERLLKAFSGLTIVTINDHTGNVLFRGVQTLSSVQSTILQILGFEELYANLQNSP